jgi:hypothetical protein
MRGYKLKGGALQLTLFIVVVIALLLMTFILFTHTHGLFSSQSKLLVQTIKNSNTAVDYTLLNEVKLNDSTRIELDTNLDNTLTVHREFWGLFERVTSISRIKNNVIKKIALVGGSKDKNPRTALYLSDNSHPLVVVGNTVIKGHCYLPQKGVKSGHISGHSYNGSQLIYGTSEVSRAFPGLDKEVTDQMMGLANQYELASAYEFLNIESEKTYQNSFFNPTKLVFSLGDITLTGVSLTGNIVIQSKTKIIVEDSSSLKDVILIAPEIELQDRLKATFQAFATKNIYVGSNVKLEYPSALVLNEDTTNLVTDENKISAKPKVLIKQNSQVKGVIVFLGQPRENNYQSQIELEKGSIVMGQVYCNENIDLKGTVLGSVYTNNFISKQDGSVYQNHIYGGIINSDELQEEFIGVRLSNSRKGIIKWLY